MAAERGCRRGSHLFLTVAAAALAGCVGVLNPVTGEEDWSTVTEAQELALGAEAHQQLLKEYGYYDDPALQAYVAEVGLHKLNIVNCGLAILGVGFLCKNHHNYKLASYNITRYA